MVLEFVLRGFWFLYWAYIVFLGTVSQVNYVFDVDGRSSLDYPCNLKMNDFNLQKNAVPFCEESGGWISISDSKGPAVCPKPRRVGVMAYSPGRPLRWNMSTHRAGMYDVKAGAELLDIILTREGHGADPFTSQVASSPPFFCGSPPTRVGNPLIQDARFGEEERSPPSPSTATLKGGCARMKVGYKAAAVRVEGFDCLNRDHQNSRIRTMA